MNSNSSKDTIIAELQARVEELSADRKLAEDALLKSEELYRTITDNITEAVWIMDLNLKLTFVSPSMARLRGYSPDELMNTPLKDQLTDDSYADAMQFMATVLTEKHLSDKDFSPTGILDVEVRNKDNTTYWTELRMTLLRDPRGNAIGILGVGRDVTDTRKIQTQLRRSEERFARIAETLTDYMYTVRFENGKPLQTVHGAGCEMVTGFSPADFERSAHLWITMVHPDDRQNVRTFFSTIVEKPLVNPIEHRIVRKDGTERWVRNTPVFHFDDAGNMLSYDGIVQDITERKLAEQEVYREKERYRHLFNNISDGIVLNEISASGFPGKILEVNDAECKMLGRGREELYDTTPKDLVEILNIENFSEVGIAMREKRHATFDRTLIAKNGDRVPVEVNSHLIELGGKQVVLSISRDISERLQAQQKLLESERRYREMFETSADGIVTMNLEGIILDCNQAFLAMLGYATTSDIVMKSFLTLTPEDYHKLDIQMTHETRINGYSKVYEKEYLRQNGERFFVNIRRWLIRDNNDSPAGMWAIVRDISEKKKMDAEMLKAEHLESLSMLAGGIAHDFNNLLGGIFGYIDIAREFADSPEKTNEYLDKALKSLDRAKDLSQRLLTFAKGGAPIKKAANMAEVVLDAVTLACAGQNVKPRLKFAKNLPTCEIDIAQISRVFNNLVVNAVQAMPEGGTIGISTDAIAVTTALGLTCADGNYVRVSVYDTGCGIPKDMIAKVFDPFFTTKKHGTGLGLSICQSIVEKHCGAMSVESEPGVGTTMHVYIPASVEKVTAPLKKSSHPVHGVGKILVMDDEDFVLDIATQMLTKLGYSVATAGHGEEAIAVFCKARETGAPFDAVMLDLTIPGGMGGAKTCERLHAIDQAAVIIASSGYSNDPVMADPTKFGFAAMLKKPYVTNDLSGLLNKLLAHK
jgi:PAS domain S-box-containing protein